MADISDEVIALCCKAGFKAGRSLGTYQTRTAAVDHFVRAVLEEYIRQLSEAMPEQHKTADAERQLVFAGIDPAGPDGAKDGMVLMTMTAEGPRVVGITDDPAMIHEFIKKAVE